MILNEQGRYRANEVYKQSFILGKQGDWQTIEERFKLKFL